MKIIIHTHKWYYKFLPIFILERILHKQDPTWDSYTIEDTTFGNKYTYNMIEVTKDTWLATSTLSKLKERHKELERTFKKCKAELDELSIEIEQELKNDGFIQ